MMDDAIGDMPEPTSYRDALEHCKMIAQDKRGHIGLRDHCDWLELRLKAIITMAERGLALTYLES